MSLNGRIGMYCVLGGLCFTISALGAGHFWHWWLAGVLIAASLVPVVRFGTRHSLAQTATIWVLLVVVGLACSLAEGALFFPSLRAEAPRDFMGGAVVYLIAAAVLVVLAKLWQLPDGSALAVEHRPVWLAIPMVLLAGLSYVVYYQIFGGIAYEYFTKQYYPQAASIVQPLGLWFYVYQWARGTLMVLALLPVIYTLRLPRWKAALAMGALAWIVGGGATLLVPNPMMIPLQRFEHIVEIMTQNVSLGVTAVYLLRPKAVKPAPQPNPLPMPVA